MPTILGVKRSDITHTKESKKTGKLRVIEKKFNRTHYVLADTIDQSIEIIQATTGLPQIYDTENGASVINVETEEVDNVVHPNTGVATTLWEHKSEYDSSVDPNEHRPGEEDDPTIKTPTVRWSGEIEEELMEEDVNGKAVATVLGEQIIATKQYVMPILEITRYENFPFDPNIILNYTSKINSQEFWGAKPGTALMLPMEVDEETVAQVRYAIVKYRIKFKIKPGEDEPWKLRLLHQGYKYLPVKGDANYKPVYNEERGIYIQPPRVNTPTEGGSPELVNLNLDGTRNFTDKPVFVEFDQFEKINFNNLSLGPF